MSFIFKSTELQGSIQQVGRDWPSAQGCRQHAAAHISEQSVNTLTDKATGWQEQLS